MVTSDEKAEISKIEGWDNENVQRHKACVGSYMEFLTDEFEKCEKFVANCQAVLTARGVK